jgi:protein gp37
VPTAIEWTNETWNPTSGCTQVSAGCDNCYAMRFAERFRGTPGHYYEHGFDVALRPNMLHRPRKWREPRLVFVNSMSDLFHVAIPDGYIDKVFDEMELNGHHTFQLLTKRPERMRRFLMRRYRNRVLPSNLWLGVSVEDASAKWRVEMLSDIRAAIRFISAEPLLGPIKDVPLEFLDWVIVGGESGPRRRNMQPSWVRDIRDRCIELRVAFFFKQWHKGDTGRLLDGRTWDEMPELSTR